MSEIDTIELPSAQLDEMRKEVWAWILQPDRKASLAAYRELVATISHPAAIVRGRMVRGTQRLQSRLNRIMVLGWCMDLIAVACVVLAISLSWWFAAGVPVFVLRSMALNGRQTRANVELAARLFLLDRLMEEDPELLEKIQSHGAQV